MQLEQELKSINSFIKGFKDGIPIGLGYLSVSIAFGMAAVNMGLPIWAAVLISLTNLTSAGQFAGIGLITAGASFLEMALAQLVVNSRYALMSLALSQKVDESVHKLHRLLLSFGITDEVFAVASGQPANIGKGYMYGLITVPYWGWALGTLIGAAAGTFFPAPIRSALNIAIYGMFIAIILPPAKTSRPVAVVLLVAVALSFLLRYAPMLSSLSGGLVIVICAVVAAAVGALLFPRGEVN